jgi:hypothetical protein
MSEANASAPQSVKTLGIQLPDDLHAQFSLVAGLEGLSLKDAVLAAVRGYIAERRGALAEKANQALADIERNAAMQRDALTALFGAQPDAAEVAKPGKPAGKRTTE